MIHKATVAITHKREREGEREGARERETLARGRGRGAEEALFQIQERWDR